MYIVLLLTFWSFLLPASAWLPGVHKTLVSENGTNLFNSTPGYYRNSTKTKRWTPASGKIRGVNLGSMFVFEPWIAETAWSNMGCGSYNSEFDCVSGLGQSAANAAFQSHWNSWITQTDITQMQSYGLNTIRIPVGYWLYESLVYSDSEYFPQGGLAYLEQVCGWASNAGFYIIIDMHGAPGAQVAQNADTGQVVLTHSASAVLLTCFSMLQLPASTLTTNMTAELSFYPGSLHRFTPTTTFAMSVC
jgi:hypothetical protein